MTKSEVLNEKDIIKILNESMDKEVVGAKKAAHGGVLVIEYQNQ